MIYLNHLTICAISLITIVLSCILFTNAIEFLGNKLKLGNNATGSILAVLGTGLPETIVPIVALLGTCFSNTKTEIGQDIAFGAILGSPFILATLALLLLSIVMALSKKTILKADYQTVLRDYKYFLIAYFVAFIFMLNFFNQYKNIAAILLLMLYIFFVYRTITKSRSACKECECKKLYFSKIKLKGNFALFLQLAISLSILILSSHFFVNEIKFFSEFFKLSPMILAFLITPFATELPEIINSIIWLKQGKDDLALANILGAVVFQTSVLFAIGIIFTSWNINKYIFVNIILVMLSSFIFVFLTAKDKKIKILNLLFCGLCYILFLIYLFFC